jgi:hypothetical protein
MLLLTSLAACAALTLAPPPSDVRLYSDRIEFATDNGTCRTVDVLFFDWSIDLDPPQSQDGDLADCVASAATLCGVHNVKSLNWSKCADGTTTCRFECKDGKPTLPGH